MHFDIMNHIGADHEFNSVTDRQTDGQIGLAQ